MPTSVASFVILVLTYDVVVIFSERQGTLRFARNGIGDTSQSWSSGIVQIYYSGEWGNICDKSNFGGYSSFDFNEAEVICHQLSYIGATSYTNTGSSSLYGTDLSSTAMYDVSCSSSSYLTITQCSFDASISSYCDNSDDVIVTCYTTRIWDSPALAPGYIRLTGGNYSNEGLLEVYCNGQWGTVCINGFGSTAAIVACKQLGYNGYPIYAHLSSSGLSSQPIWLDYLYSCSSSDSCLTSCQSCPSSENHDCTHNEDVTLECEYSSVSSKVSSNTMSCALEDTSDLSQGTLRFVRNGVADTSQLWSSGIVQIYYSGEWGNICHDESFGMNEAHVICHQLGYTDASSYANTGSSSLYGVDFFRTATDEVSCSSSTYLTITQCSFDTYVIPPCDDDRDVIVTCYTTRIWDSPSSGDIRLTGGDYSNEGLLEIYCNGEWGTVCDSSFGIVQAEVACRQLGYNDYYNYDHLSLQGLPRQPIWLGYFTSCFSRRSSSCLTSCQSCPFTERLCDHSEDVTLQCEYYSTNSKATTNSTIDCSTDITTSTSSNSESQVASGVSITIFSISIIMLIIVGVVIFKRKKHHLCSGRLPHTAVVAQPSTVTTTMANSLTVANSSAAIPPTGENETVFSTQPSSDNNHGTFQQAPPPQYPGIVEQPPSYPGPTELGLEYPGPHTRPEPPAYSTRPEPPAYSSQPGPEYPIQPGPEEPGYPIQPYPPTH